MGYGGKREGAGRPKGTENKVTMKTREVISRIADDMAEEFASWIRDVAIDDKKGAADLYLKAIEYHIPKLARTESKVEGELTTTINVNSQIPFAPNEKPKDAD